MKIDLTGIDDFLRFMVYRNSNLLPNENEDILYLIDIIASMQNLLHEIITGLPYDYAYHWTNKVGYDGIVDTIFEAYKEETHENN